MLPCLCVSYVCIQAAKVTAKFGLLLRLVTLCDRQLAKITKAAVAAAWSPASSSGAGRLADVDKALEDLAPLLMRAGEALDEYTKAGFLWRCVTCPANERDFLELQAGIQDVMHVGWGGAALGVTIHKLRPM